MDKSKLISEITEAHRRMSDALEHLSDEQLLRRVMDDWTGKDLLAHMAWWHDNSASVIASLRAGQEPYDSSSPENTTDALNERTYREHQNDPTDAVRRAFGASFNRLLAALEPVTDEQLITEDCWPWLGGEALAEMILWDTSRHYDAHRKHFEALQTA